MTDAAHCVTLYKMTVESISCSWIMMNGVKKVSVNKGAMRTHKSRDILKQRTFFTYFNPMRHALILGKSLSAVTTEGITWVRIGRVNFSTVANLHIANIRSSKVRSLQPENKSPTIFTCQLNQACTLLQHRHAMRRMIHGDRKTQYSHSRDIDTFTISD